MKTKSIFAITIAAALALTSCETMDSIAELFSGGGSVSQQTNGSQADSPSFKREGAKIHKRQNRRNGLGLVKIGHRAQC